MVFTEIWNIAKENYDYYLKDRVDTSYNDAKRWLGYRQPLLFHVDTTPIEYVEEIYCLLDELGYKNIGSFNLSQSEQNDLSRIVFDEQLGPISNLHYPAIYFGVPDGSWVKLAFGTSVVLTGLTAPYVVPYCLGVLGFVKSGVVANSLAASIQSIFFKGTTTGIFSLLQSAGAGGLSVAGNVAVGGVASSTVVAGAKITEATLDPAVADQVFNPDLKLKVMILYRQGRKWEDFTTVSKFLKENFAVDTEKMDVIGMESGDEKEIKFNDLCKEEKKLPIAPGCILSLEFTRKHQVRNQALDILKNLQNFRFNII